MSGRLFGTDSVNSHGRAQYCRERGGAAARLLIQAGDLAERQHFEILNGRQQIHLVAPGLGVEGKRNRSAHEFGLRGYLASGEFVEQIDGKQQ
jgi:hypothetical protein